MEIDKSASAGGMAFKKNLSVISMDANGNPASGGTVHSQGPS
jgi:hypothetical protein